MGVGSRQGSLSFLNAQSSCILYHALLLPLNCLLHWQQLGCTSDKHYIITTFYYQFNNQGLAGCKPNQYPMNAYYEVMLHPRIHAVQGCILSSK